MSDKTEEPTPKRLLKAREEGDTPLSIFASQSVAFSCAVAMAPAALVALSSQSAKDLRAAIAKAAESAPTAIFDPTALASTVLVLSIPIFTTTVVVVAVTSMIQAGGVLTAKKLAPDLARLNPALGLRRLASQRSLVTIVRATAFGALVAWIVGDALTRNALAIAHTAGHLDRAGRLASSIALDIGQKVAVVGLLFGAVDVLLARRSWRHRLKMTHAERERERRESDGDPQVKSARERAHREALSTATLAHVARASVVVVNASLMSCALRYDENAGDRAPIVLASGRGELAKHIATLAQRHHIPIVEDASLASALVDISIGDEISETHYEAVAEVLRAARSSKPDTSPRIA